MNVLPFSIRWAQKYLLFSYVTLCLLIIMSCPLMASVLILVSTGLSFSSALICQLLPIKEMSSYYSKPSCERGKPISHWRRVKAVSVDEALMVQFRQSGANKRLIKTNGRDLQANRDLCLTDTYKKLRSREFIGICRSCGQDRFDIEYLYNMYRIMFKSAWWIYLHTWIPEQSAPSQQPGRWEYWGNWWWPTDVWSFGLPALFPPWMVLI